MLPSCNFKSRTPYEFATKSIMLAPVLLRIGNCVSSPLAAYVCLKPRTRDTKPCRSPTTPSQESQGSVQGRFCPPSLFRKKSESASLAAGCAVPESRASLTVLLLFCVPLLGLTCITQANSDRDRSLSILLATRSVLLQIHTNSAVRLAASSSFFLLLLYPHLLLIAAVHFPFSRRHLLAPHKPFPHLIPVVV
ncbi:uncharacterized protein K452DRAFT_80395 [Aplosporella prunicola CBS 121167]|uniref:Uncharacterized protein n=1 Tax=Aplosporella prunicola CBS 121167 TaxID=1176127 RepID=A0A6A6B831_9PEZI|nr:uncharacterized protein K452DRAFT_80395 [Aplosporella prunicola CBS 121167]KAF2139067.1 hypothetical protein K452DRAFT_80395 [Aplosporella prunicola CBS 121167]